MSSAKGSKKQPQDDSISNSTDKIDIVIKPPFWSWKVLKAFTRIRSRRFHCCFSLEVYSIEGLPSFFYDTCLVVHWKSSDGEPMMTSPFQAYNGVALSGDLLALSCPIYFNRGGSGSHSLVKYERKHFVLYASVPEAPELDLGKHHIDLTRLLPVSMDELEGEKISGEWPTSFRLSGKARGALMHVKFGYVIVGNNRTVSPCNDVSEVQNLHHNAVDTEIFHEHPVDSIKDLHEVVQEPWLEFEQCEAEIIDFDKLEESFDSYVTNKFSNDPFPSNADNEEQNPPTTHLENIGLTSQEEDIHAFQVNEKDGESLILELDQCEAEIIDFDNLEETFDSSVPSASNADNEEQDPCTTSAVIVGEHVSHLENIGLNSQVEEIHAFHDFQVNESEPESPTANLISSEFLKMLGLDSNSPCLVPETEPESPRERLLRQFEEDELFNGGFLNFDSPVEPFTKLSKDPETMNHFQELEESLASTEKTENQPICNLFKPVLPSQSTRTEQGKPDEHEEEEETKAMQYTQENKVEIFDDQLIPRRKLSKDPETMNHLQQLAESLVPTEDNQPICNLFEPVLLSPRTEQEKRDEHEEEEVTKAMEYTHENKVGIFNDPLIARSKTTKLDSKSLKMNFSKRKLRISTSRLSYGPGWLLANGMGRTKIGLYSLHK